MAKARKNGEGTFCKDGEYYMWTLDLGRDPVTGKRRQKVVKRRDLKELKALVRQYLRDREDGVPSTKGNALTGDAWAERWLANVAATREATTHATYETTWRKWLRPRLGRRALERIGMSDVQAAVNDAVAVGHGRTAAYALQVAKRMLNAARRHSPPFIRHDPCEGVSVPRAAPERQRVLSHEEVEEVLAELYREGPMATREGTRHAYRHRHLVRFLLETGLRRSEACGLQVFSVDLQGEVPSVHVRAQAAFVEGRLQVKPYTKARSVRTVPLSDAAIEAYREHRALVRQDRLRAGEAYDDHSLAFPSEEGTPVNPHNLLRTAKRLQAAVNERRAAEGHAPREPWTLHDLRRTFGTRIAQGGANMKETQTLMGHARVETTAKIYVVAEQEGLARAVRNMRNRKGA